MKVVKRSATRSTLQYDIFKRIGYKSVRRFTSQFEHESMKKSYFRMYYTDVRKMYETHAVSHVHCRVKRTFCRFSSMCVGHDQS